jgi:hypothetical protein
MESLFSFPVGLFHPLQHAGLSRRTPDRRQPGVAEQVGKVSRPDDANACEPVVRMTISIKSSLVLRTF